LQRQYVFASGLRALVLMDDDRHAGHTTGTLGGDVSLTGPTGHLTKKALVRIGPGVASGSEKQGLDHSRLT
jgi:hypothetical protein